MADKKKKSGVFSTVLAAIFVIILVLAIVGGVLGALIRSNFKGIGEASRKHLQNIPFVSMVLPPKPDPDDPKYLTEKELISKYNELRALKTELNASIDEKNKLITDLENYKASEEKRNTEIEAAKRELEVRETELIKKEEELKKTKIDFDAEIAKKDKASFKQFYEKLDPENSKQIYSEIVKIEQEDAQAKQYSAIYQEMDAESAAEIFEAMGATKLDLIVTTLKYMNRQKAAEILAAMNTDFSAVVSNKLSTLYMK